jgi:hypothetical protein
LKSRVGPYYTVLAKYSHIFTPYPLSSLAYTPEMTTVKEALEVIEGAIKVHDEAVEQFESTPSDSGSRKVLYRMGKVLQQICSSLEYILDDEDVCDRIDQILVGSMAHQRRLLPALIEDIRLIEDYLQKLLSVPTAVDELLMESYNRVLERYLDLSKNVRKKCVHFT